VRAYLAGLDNWSALRAVISLYAGKLSGVLTTLLFLPIFNRYLSPTEFGIAAIILSIQALMIALDFGLSTMATREIASNPDSRSLGTELVRRSEAGLVLVYALLMAAVSGAKYAGFFHTIPWSVVTFSVALFLLIVLHNLYYCALIAKGSYSDASMLQVAGNTARGGVTAVALMYLSASIEVFVVTQFTVALLQVIVARRICIEKLGFLPVDVKPFRLLQSGVELIFRAKSLAIVSLAGAAVMQLDKPIIALLIDAESVAPYFLAMTLCLTPTSILAGPINQFFQPKILASCAQNATDQSRNLMRQFSAILVVLTVVPTLIVWLFADTLVRLWLGASLLTADTTAYTSILLPGIAVGALGYLPLTLLLACKDYRFQAALSVALSATTLMAVAYAASEASVTSICYVYFAYHVLSTVLLWWRAASIPQVRAMALSSAVIALPATLALLLPIFFQF
jgi:O-antigen/teichoic acid export membrane protein